MNSTRVGASSGVLVGTTVAPGMTKTVWVGGAWVGVARGTPQATSSAMTAEKPTMHDSHRLAALKLTGFTCSMPAVRAAGCVQ
jgi:hypothetical protein